MAVAIDHNDALCVAFLEAKAQRMLDAATRGNHHGASLRHDANVLLAAASDIRAGLHRPDEGDGHAA
jgi:hypothetical protein